jgi:hypothetical protein
VALLGLAFRTFTTDLTKVIPHLKTFFESITTLMTALAGFEWEQLGKIGAAFLGIAGFVALLGLAFRTFTTDLTKVIPHLKTFFESIATLMATLARFKPGEMVTIGAGFLIIAGFVWLLGKALSTLTDQALASIDPLTEFIGTFPELMNALARFSPGEMIQIGIGFLMIAGFVWLLSMALNTLTEQSIGAIDPLAKLFEAMSGLATKLASMSAGEMITMAIGLLLIAGFVWAVAAALKFAAGPLEILGKMFESFGAILSKIGDIAGRVWGVLSDIGGFFKDVGGGIADFVTGDLFGSVDLQTVIDRDGVGPGDPTCAHTGRRPRRDGLGARPTGARWRARRRGARRPDGGRPDRQRGRHQRQHHRGPARGELGPAAHGRDRGPAAGEAGPAAVHPGIPGGQPPDDGVRRPR